MASRIWLVTDDAGYIGAHVIRAPPAWGRRAVVVEERDLPAPSSEPRRGQQ